MYVQTNSSIDNFKPDIGTRSVKKISPENVKKILLSEARDKIRTN
jgi:hypothetical protein